MPPDVPHHGGCSGDGGCMEEEPALGGVVTFFSILDSAYHDGDGDEGEGDHESDGGGGGPLHHLHKSHAMVMDEGGEGCRRRHRPCDDGSDWGAEVMPADRDSPDRVGRVWSARLNLLTSMVGGGSLSLPLAFSLAGNALGGPLLVLLCASAASFTLRALMDASARCSHLNTTPERRRGRQGQRQMASYEMVASAAFGPSAKYVTQALVVLVCYFGTLAYCVLLRDLGVPLAHAISPPRGDPVGPNSDRPTVAENLIMFAVVLLVSPLCTLKTLTALRQVGALSMLSVAVLGCCVVYRSVQCNSFGKFESPYVMPPHDPSWREYLTTFPASFRDFADAFPVVLSCFFCHFNAVPVHAELRDPTPERVTRLARSTIGSASVFYLIVGFFGSMYGNCTLTGRVQGNILLDFDDDDPVLAVGRIALALTIALAFPMQVIPARDTLIRLMSAYHRRGRGGYGDSGTRSDGATEGGHHSNGEGDEDMVASMNGSMTEPLLSAPPSADGSGDCLVGGADERCPSDTSTTSEAATPPPTPRRCGRSDLLRIGVALLLFYTAALIASLVRSVDVVWDLLGSSLVILIGFLIPSAAFLRICKGHGGAGCGLRYRRVFAWALIVILVPLMVLCTANAVVNLFVQ